VKLVQLVGFITNKDFICLGVGGVVRQLRVFGNVQKMQACSMLRSAAEWYDTSQSNCTRHVLLRFVYVGFL